MNLEPQRLTWGLRYTQMPTFDSYVICTTPRSGSTLLCRLLQETGVAGHPQSWFHRPSVDDWRSDLGLSAVANSDDSLRETVDAAIGRGRGASPIFALRLQQHSFHHLMSCLRQLAPDSTTDVETLTTVFGRARLIYLSRTDVLAQAVSYVRASQTGLWHRNADGSELERLAPPREPIYDRVAIATELAALTAQNDAWREWFEVEQVTPLTLTYEQLAQNPIGVLGHILDDLGFDPAVCSTVATPTARLSDRTNRAWIARFQADTKSL